MEKQDLNNFSALNVLIIDDHSLVHHTIKNTLAELGVQNIVSAENAYYAIRLCEKTRFHVVICAFNVKSDKDGFHLLEELKFKGYVNKRTVLIFLSADTEETLVNGIVELQPDDFWVKPLSPKSIKERLAYILEVKKTLFNVYEAFDKNEYSKAIYYVERHLLNNKLHKYHLNLMRMKGDSLLNLREFTEAETFYEALLELHKYSWMYVGYAKSLIKQNKIDEISELLQKMQDKPDTRFATYDLLAEHYIDQQDYENAYDVIKKATKLSPRNIERNKKFWDLARLNHDHEGQFKATQAMARIAKNSVHDSPDLTLNVIRAGIDFASTLPEESSKKILRQVEHSIHELEGQAQSASQLKEQIFITKARVFNLKNERDLAERLVDAHVSLKAKPSLEDNLDKVKVFHELGKREEALVLLESVQKQITGDNLTGQVVSRYIEQELKARSEIHFTAKQLNEMAIEYFNKSRFEASINSLNQALMLTPKNARVMLSILKVLVVIHRKDGLDTDQRETANEIVDLLGSSKLNEKQFKTFKSLEQELQGVISVS